MAAGLWSVDDEVSKQINDAFYYHLTKGAGESEALRAAQIEIRRKISNPYYWAGFVWIGDPGNRPNPSTQI